MYQKIFAWVHKYERHISALAMVAGFVADNILFGRVDDLWQTQLVLISYALACLIAIPLHHFIEARAERGRPRPRWIVLLTFTTQFALGGFWSAFVIFYGRSAVVSASWPFLLFIFLVFLGSEYFHKYHARLVFTSTLFFFALYSYAIFAVPVFTGSIGTMTFLGSGVAAVCVFELFTVLLRILGRERFLADVWRIRAGALAVLVIINIFYFTNILPPLPLSASATGVYHSVVHSNGAYVAVNETIQSWGVRYLGFAPTMHITQGESLSAYSSVFAPTRLTTTIVHRWQLYDMAEKRWVTRAVVAYPIIGGRDGGYKGYSTVRIDTSGEWRVSVETMDGRTIARLPFVIEIAATQPTEETIILD
ncbi:MAG: DUF2914 domain-containing protein [Candidatus Paceibacterota bacterium]